MLLPVFIWVTDGKTSSTWPTRAWVILSVLLVGGVCFFLFGVLASNQKIESTRIVATEGNLLMAVLATPLYVVLRGIQRRKLEQSSYKTHDRVA